MTSWLLNGLHNLHLQQPLFESTDPAMTKTKTAGMLQDHQLTWRTGKVNSALRCVHIGELSFMLLRYGAAVHISPGTLSDFYLFQVPVQGQSAIGVGHHTVIANQDTATIISPNLELKLDWEEGCEQFLIKIPKNLLDEAARQFLGVVPEKTINFHPQYSLNHAHGIAWQHQISAVLAYANHQDLYPVQWLKNHTLSLLQHLLITQPNNVSHHLHHNSLVTGQRRLRLARRYIEQNLNEPLRLEEIAQASESSVRSLTAAFKKQLNLSPTQYIRKMRLEAVHNELLLAKPTDTVTNIATRWGFNHLGRFSIWYKDTYHESPSTTLRK